MSAGPDAGASGACHRGAGTIADDRIAAGTLTGSTQIGQIVAAQAGQAMKTQVLDLGGSDSFIVLPDAHIARTGHVAVEARLTNGGQSCVSAKRFIIHEAVADHFIKAFAAGIRSLTIGDPMDPATRIGPMARMNLCADLHDRVTCSIADGAELAPGGAPLDGPGSDYAPTLLGRVTPEQTSFREELFGPVASAIRCADAGEAVALANDTEFGLGAAIWTPEMGLARRMARQIDAGAVFVNGMVASDARLPFWSIKKSGAGRKLGSYGIREITNIKMVWFGSAT